MGYCSINNVKTNAQDIVRFFYKNNTFDPQTILERTYTNIMKGAKDNHLTALLYAKYVIVVMDYWFRTSDTYRAAVLKHPGISEKIMTMALDFSNNENLVKYIEEQGLNKKIITKTGNEKTPVHNERYDIIYGTDSKVTILNDEGVERYKGTVKNDQGTFVIVQDEVSKEEFAVDKKNIKALDDNNKTVELQKFDAPENIKNKKAVLAKGNINYDDLKDGDILEVVFTPKSAFSEKHINLAYLYGLKAKVQNSNKTYPIAYRGELDDFILNNITTSKIFIKINKDNDVPTFEIDHLIQRGEDEQLSEQSEITKLLPKIKKVKSLTKGFLFTRSMETADVNTHKTSKDKKAILTAKITRGVLDLLNDSKQLESVFPNGVKLRLVLPEFSRSLGLDIKDRTRDNQPIAPLLIITDDKGNPLKLKIDANDKLSIAADGEYIVYKTKDFEKVASRKGDRLSGEVKNNEAFKEYINSVTSKGLTIIEAEELLKTELKTFVEHTNSLLDDSNKIILATIISGSKGEFNVFVTYNEMAELKDFTAKDTSISIASSTDLITFKKSKIKEGLPILTTNGYALLLQAPALASTNVKETVKKLLFSEIKDEYENVLSSDLKDSELKKFIHDVKALKGAIAAESSKLNIPSEEAFENLLTKFDTNGFPIIKLDFINSLLQSDFDLPVISNNNVLTYNDTNDSLMKTNYIDFLKDNKFKVQVSKNEIEKGTIEALNPNLEFSFSKNYTEELKKDAEITEPKVTPVVKQTTSRRSVDEIVNKYKDDTENSVKNEWEKKANVRKFDIDATMQQIEAAKKWFMNHSMSKHIKFEEAFDMINNGKLGEFNNAVITLFKGANYSDLYHEAWHAFTQRYLTQVERDALYDELKKSNNKFTNFAGNLVSFKDATSIELEEYLAESFRSYMLNGQKVIVNAPKQTSIFKRIWNALKDLVSDGPITVSFAEPHITKEALELFEKLRNDDMAGYSFKDASNEQFKSLNKIDSIINIDENGNKTILTPEEALKASQMVDNFFGEAIQITRVGFADYHEVIKYLNHKTKLELHHAGISILDEDTLKEYNDNVKEKEQILKDAGHTNDLFKVDNDFLKIAYRHSIIRFELIFDELQETYNNLSETDPKRNDLANKIDLFTRIINSFGDVRNIEQNINIAGIKDTVIGFHIEQNELFKETEISLTDLEEDYEKDALSSHSWKGKEIKTSPKELASQEIIFILKTLPGYEKNTDGKWIPAFDEFGVRQIHNFYQILNRIITDCENVTNLDIVYQKLVASQDKYPPYKALLERLGDPNTNIILWGAFDKLRTSRIKLYQVTHETSKNEKSDVIEVTKVGDASSVNNAVRKEWISTFLTHPETQFIKKDNKGVYLDITALKKAYPGLTANSEKIFQFLNDIGIRLDHSKELLDELTNPNTFRLYDPKYLFNDYENVTEIRDISKFISNNSKYFNDLAQLQAKHGSYIISGLVSNAADKSKNEYRLHNSLSKIVSKLNEAIDYQAVLDDPALAAFLDIRDVIYDENDNLIPNPKYNPEARNSILLRSLFNFKLENGVVTGTRRVINNNVVKLELKDLSGTKVLNTIDNNSNGLTKDQFDDVDNYLSEIILGVNNVFENVRHADKKMSYALVLSEPIYGKSKKSEGYVTIKDIQDNKAINVLYNSYVKNYIKGELSRMVRAKNLLETAKVADFIYLERAKEFATFEGVFTMALQNEIKSKLNTIEDVNKIMTDYNKTFSAQFEEYMLKVIEETQKPMEKLNWLPKDIIRKFNNKNNETTAIKDAITYYTLNNYVHNIEQTLLIYGNTAMYDSFTKRVGGFGSTGEDFRQDSFMNNYLNSSTTWENSYAKKQLGMNKNPYVANGIINSTVISEIITESEYYEYLKDVLGETKAKNYKKQSIHDGQGWVTFDAYRMFKLQNNEWTPECEFLYKKINNGEEVNIDDVRVLFSALKVQYMGAIANSNMPLVAMHKFSLIPLIPTVIKNSRLKLVHDQLVREGIHYMTGQTGSKAGTLGVKPNSTVTHKNGFTQTYDDAGLLKLYNDKGEFIFEQDSYNKDNHVFTKTEVFLEYLKNQLPINTKWKNKAILTSQGRKLIQDGMWENGVPVDFRPEITDKDERLREWISNEEETEYVKKTRHFESLLQKLEDIERTKLNNEIGYDESTKSITDIPKLLEFLKNTLDREDFEDQHLDFLKSSTLEDLSYNVNAEKIEYMINALIAKRLIKLQVNGEGLVQVSSALLEAQHTVRFTKNTNSKYLKESTTLPYYIQGNDKTLAMKVKIALKGDFKHLLQLKDKEGNVIGTLDRLNQLLKDDEWLDMNDHRKMITLTSVRIPVQGINSMEFMEVYEFMEESFGPSIILPSEIVTKTGSDFDIDKMITMLPSIINIGGIVQLSNKTKTNKTEKELKAAIKKERIEIRNINDHYEAIVKLYAITEFIKTLDPNDERLENLKKERNDLAKQTKYTIDDIKEISPIDRNKLKTVNASINKAEAFIVAIKGKLKTVTDEKQKQALNLKLEDKENELLTYKETLTEIYSNYIKEEALKRQKAEVEAPTKRLHQYQRELEGLSSNAISNQLIDAFVDMLSLPENFKKLVTPNDTDLFTNDEGTGIADRMEAMLPGYSPYKNKNDKATSKFINRSTPFEPMYNQYMHMVNKVGMETLGLGAIDNTYNILMNMVGFKFYKVYGDIDEHALLQAIETNDVHKLLLNYRQNMPFPHNKLDGAISLSHLKNVDGVNISDVISQMINGWVDVAKKAWIYYIQGNKQVTPVLTMMLQAGVSIETAILFVSNPLVREYVDLLRTGTSVFARQLGFSSNSAYLNANEAKEKMLKKYYPNLYKAVSDTVNTPAIKKSLGDREASIDEKITYIINTKLNENLQFKNDDLERRVKDSTDTYDKTDTDDKRIDTQIFLNYLRLEKMAQGIRDFKVNTNVDTSRDVTSYESVNREEKLMNLERSKSFSGKYVENLKENSPIKPFFIGDFQMSILKTLFPSRSDSTMHKFINKEITQKEVNNTYPGDKVKTITKFKNNFINFLFQNKLKEFDISLIDDYRDYKITKKIGLPNPAIIEKGILKVDITHLQRMYLNKDFSKINFIAQDISSTIASNTFDTEDEFIHFMIERAVMKEAHPLTLELQTTSEFKFALDIAKIKYGVKATSLDEKTVINAAYEIYIINKSLNNIFNYTKMFKSDRTYAAEYVGLKENYPELANLLLPSNLTITDLKGSYNLKMVDPYVDSNVKQLIRLNKHELSNTGYLANKFPNYNSAQINEIADFFSRFDIVAYLQSANETRSSFSLMSIADTDRINDVIKEAVKDYERLKNEYGFDFKDNNPLYNYLLKYKHAFLRENNLNLGGARVRGMNYYDGVTPNNLESYTGENKQVSNPYAALKDVKQVRFGDKAPVNVYTTPESHVGQRTFLEFYHNCMVIFNDTTLKTDKSKAFKNHDSATSNTLGLKLDIKWNDKNNEPNPEAVKVINEFIERLTMIKNNQQYIPILFPIEGVGQDLTHGKADKTYEYLNVQLARFGYINKNALLSAAVVQIINDTSNTEAEKAYRYMSNTEVYKLITKC